MKTWPFAFYAVGEPVTKGSGFAVSGGRLIELGRSKREKWEAAIRKAWTEFDPPEDTLDEPCSVKIIFYMPKPKKPRFDVPATGKDIDKLARAVLDAIQETKTERGLIKNDARVVDLSILQRYATDIVPPGVGVLVERWER